MRTIRVELLREGPPHNQLLSPLTRYLALVGNQTPEAFHVSVEHNDFLSWQGEIFSGSPGSGVELATREVTRILDSLQGLRAEMSNTGPGEQVEISLVLSAFELSALPFELARAPKGFPGEGQPLVIQNRPIVLTRGSRRLPTTATRWPERPTILVVGGPPLGRRAVPLHANVLAMRYAVAPFIGWLPPGRVVEELEAHIHVIADASLRKIADACQARIEQTGANFTHVHVLAHGNVPAKASGPFRQWGLHLAADSGSHMRLASAEDLETALRGKCTTLDPPSVLTLAVCHGGDNSNVLSIDAGFAHRLHEKGVSLVVASQFPLSYTGSAVMTEYFYTELLEGCDPRMAVHRVRSQLHRQSVGDRSANDWASLVVYGAWPHDNEASLQLVRRTRARKAADVALRVAEREAWANRMDSMSEPPTTPYLRFHRALLRLFNVSGVVDGPRFRASVALRWADVLVNCEHQPLPPRMGSDEVRLTGCMERELIRSARDDYASVFRESGDAYALVQKVGLSWVLSHAILKGEESDGLRGPDKADWSKAKALEQLHACETLNEVDRKRSRRLAMATELVILRMAIEGTVEDATKSSAENSTKSTADKARAEVCLRKLIDDVGILSFEAFKAWRSLRRYGRWAKDVSPELEEVTRRLRTEMEQRGVAKEWHER